MKTIRFRDLTKVNVEDLKPGTICAEGVVVEVRHETNAYFIDFASGHTGYILPGKTIEVLGRVDDSIFEFIQETVQKERSRY